MVDGRESDEIYAIDLLQGNPVRAIVKRRWHARVSIRLCAAD